MRWRPAMKKKVPDSGKKDTSPISMSLVPTLLLLIPAGLPRICPAVGVVGHASAMKRQISLQSEVNAADQHLSTIKAHLSSTFELKKYFKAGSYSRGTFISGKSDVDVFAVISRDEARHGGNYVTSDTVLDNFRRELEGRFRTTKVYQDIHAVVMEFANCKVDVVPAYFVGPNPKNWPLYNIPDVAGGWMKASPELHNAYLKQEGEKVPERSEGRRGC